MAGKPISSTPSDAVVSAKGASRARSGHLWIYRSDVTQKPQAESGSIVRLVDHRGRFIARAHYGKESEITLRIISKDDVEITRDFWLGRLRAATRWREQVVSGADAYRLVHAEGDLLPGLIVDRYGDCFAVQTLTRGMEALKAMWAELLVEEFRPRLIVERNDVKVRQLEGLPMITGAIYSAVGRIEGSPAAARVADDEDESGPAARPAAAGDLIITENGIRFRINLFEGQKTGAFLDQRENRAAAMRYARGRGLDCFSYHGSFALHLAIGCERVTAVDISEPAIESARRNAELNNIKNIDFVAANAFDLLRDYDDAGERFDTIVLDPPAFAKNRGAVEAALRGYKEINLRALRLLNPGGVLITCSCSYHVGEELFLETFTEAARDAGRAAQIVEKRSQSRDHPILLSVPETYYLKCVVARVMD
ncbi:MAG TPA: class I SAM-dependent rRNA methyltransferase [Blastocatellia bacterium]|jgi:23S rRNA (cytosine1962-C5)-methyltransferase|nr:class I SAM-dependent rRNA methyltransferase [Blastocatellia bacterium]